MDPARDVANRETVQRGGSPSVHPRPYALAHLDATLKGNTEARRLLHKDLARTLAANAIDGYDPGDCK